MFVSRLQRLLKLHERATLGRLYFTANDVHSNLRACNDVSRNCYCFFKRKCLAHVFKGHESIFEFRKMPGIIVRSSHTEIDDDADAEEDRPNNENTYARSVLLNSTKNLKSLAPPLEPIENVSDEEAEEILSKDFHAMNANDLLHAFARLSRHAKLNSQNLQKDEHRCILTAITDKLSLMSDEELHRIFQCLVVWKNKHEGNCDALSKLIFALDEECTKRSTGWNTEECLLICDYWYLLKQARKTKFVFHVLKKFGRNPKKLTPANYLHFLFIINVYRKPPFNMYEVEYALENLIDEYTTNELGVVSMAFFKTQTLLRNQELVSRINAKLLNDIDNTSDISISAIMKNTRYSTGLKDLKILAKLLQGLTKRVPNITIPCVTNILHAAACVQHYDKELIERGMEKFDTDIDKARIKDLERITWILGIFDYDKRTPLYERILTSLRDPRRETELQKFPKALLATLTHFSQVGIFPIDLIKPCFDSDYLKQVYGNNVYNVGWNLFFLENNVRLEVPEYDGPFLSPGIRDFLAKKFRWSKFQSSEKPRPADKFVMEVAHMCKIVLESERSIYIDQVLPHYVKPDIIIHLDEVTNRPIDAEPILSAMPPGTVKRVPTGSNSGKWIAVVIATQNQMIRGTDRYVGPLRWKVRLLELIGYTPVVIGWWEWRERTNLSAKEDLLRIKLRPVIDRNASAAAAL